MTEPRRTSLKGRGFGESMAHGNGWAFKSTAEPSTFQTAMRRAVSGVTVVTTRHGGRPWGLTVSAFASVCMEPPTVLVCVNSDTVTAEDIECEGRFAANLLSQDQLFVSRLCSRPGVPKFVDDYVVDGLPESVATPVLRDSLASFDCVVSETRHVGSHLVVFGEVRTVLAPEARRPLLFGEGRYLCGAEIDEVAESLVWM